MHIFLTLEPDLNFALLSLCLKLTNAILGVYEKGSVQRMGALVFLYRKPDFTGSCCLRDDLVLGNQVICRGPI